MLHCDKLPSLWVRICEGVEMCMVCHGAPGSHDLSIFKEVSGGFYQCYGVGVQIRKLCSAKWTRTVLLGILLVTCHLTKHKQIPS